MWDYHEDISVHALISNKIYLFTHTTTYMYAYVCECEHLCTHICMQHKHISIYFYHLIVNWNDYNDISSRYNGSKYSS